MVTTVFSGNLIPLELTFGIAVILSLVVAGVAYNRVEAPTIKIGKKLSNWIINRKRKK